MAEFKLNIGDPKSKKSLKREAKDVEAEAFLGKKIGDKVLGEGFGLPGYEFEITGGSDYTGVPMRKDVQGVQRKKILIVSGTGIRKNRGGRKKRRTMAGNTVHEQTAQINLKVLKHGKTSLVEEEAKPAEEKKADSKEEKPEPKEKAPEEKPKKEEKEEKKAEEPKKEEAPKKEEPKKEPEKKEDSPDKKEKS